MQENTRLHRAVLDTTAGKFNLVLKEVDLTQRTFRDDEHRHRTWRSYLAEAGFYRDLSAVASQAAYAAGVQRLVPRVYAVEETGEGQLILVLEDVGSGAPAGLFDDREASTIPRCTKQ